MKLVSEWFCIFFISVISFLNSCISSQPIFPVVEEFVKDYNKYKDYIKEIFKEIGEEPCKTDTNNIKKLLIANLESRTFLHEWLDNDEQITKSVDIFLSDMVLSIILIQQYIKDFTEHQLEELVLEQEKQVLRVQTEYLFYLLILRKLQNLEL